MPDREKILRGAECCKYVEPSQNGCPEECPYLPEEHVTCGLDPLLDDVIALLREQEPRVMTLDEVIKHYSLPPVFVDDLGAQEDYLQDIAPLYFDFPEAESWVVHWREYYSVSKYLDYWKASYGKEWRCWSAKPTDEQREAAKWDEDT